MPCLQVFSSRADVKEYIFVTLFICVRCSLPRRCTEDDISKVEYSRTQYLCVLTMMKLCRKTAVFSAVLVGVFMHVHTARAVEVDDLVKCDKLRAWSVKGLQPIVAGDLFTTGKYVRDGHGTRHEVYCLAVPNETKDELGLYSEQVELLTSITRFGDVYFLGRNGRWYNLQGGYSIEF